MLKSLLLLIITFSQLAYAKDDSKVLATIDGKPIYESEIKAKITQFAKMGAQGEDDAFNYDSLDQATKDEIVKNIVIGDLLLTEAQKAKTSNTPEYKQALEVAEKQLMQKIFLDKIIKENITEDKIKAQYKIMAEDQAKKEEYKVSHILVKTEEEAKDIKKKLDKGGDFAALAKEFSLDNNKDDGGSLGYFSSGQMVPAFEEATASLKIGEISAPVKTDFGYHIIKLEDKRKVTPMTYEQAKAKIYDSLATQFVQDYISQLQLQNKVEFSK